MRRYIPRTLRSRLLVLALLITAGAVTVSACSDKESPTESAAHS